MIATQSDPVQITGPAHRGGRRDPYPASHPVSGETVDHVRTAAATAARRRAASASSRSTRARCRISRQKQPRSARHAWSVAEPPADLCDRRVEITGPTDRKMVINALNSGANVFMADFEDSNSPTWQNMHRRPGQSARRGQRHDHIYQPRGQALRTVRDARRADGAPARLAPGGEAFPGGRASRFRRRSSISACSSFTTPAR